MNKKIIISAIFVLGFFIGLFYLTNSLSSAYEYKMTFSSAGVYSKADAKTKHTGENDNILDITVREFITKESQSDFRDKIIAIKGVKNVEFGNSCPEAKVTKVSVTFDDKEISKEDLLVEINKLGIQTKEYNGCPHGNTNQQECPHMKESNQEIKS